MANSADPDQLASSTLFAKAWHIQVQQDKDSGEWILSGEETSKIDFAPPTPPHPAF